MIVSSIEGRIRFSDENIKDTKTADKIKNSLKNLEGIESIRVNEVIGTLLVTYNEDKLKSKVIIDILKEYIDTSLKPKDVPSRSGDYINAAVDMVKKGMNSQKGKGKKGKNSQGSSNNILDNVMGNNTGTGLLKYVVYSVLGVEGVKKGKDFIQGQGQGKGKNS